MSDTKLQGVKRKLVAEDTAALREFQKTLVEGVDWWKEGVSTYWTPEAAARFHSTPAEEVPEPQGTVSELKVIALPRNSFFVLCPSPEGDGEKVAVRLLRNKTGPKLMGKTIRVEFRDGQFHQLP
jgi:hypothetical protein